MTARTYRLHPPDTTGWLLGLSGPQVITTGTVVVVSAIALSRGAPVPVAVGLLVAGSVIGLTRSAGTPVTDLAPALLRWALSQFRPQRPWLAELPLGDGPAVPAVLAGQDVLAVDAATHGFHGRVTPIAVLHEHPRHLVAATLRATGRQFGLLDPPDQDRLLQAWGDALRPLCRERNPIIQLRWTEWTAPACNSEHHRWLAQHASDDDAELDAYRALLASAAPLAARHEALITITVRTDRVPIEARHGRERIGAAIDYLLRELRLLADRLQLAGLEVAGPLSPAQLLHALRIRLDPAAIDDFDTADQTLGERTGNGDLAGLTLAAETTWRSWRVDDTFHRCFHVTTWPRNQLPADWLAPLLLHSGLTRSITVAYEPIAPSASRHAINRQAAKLESDANQRADKGFRIGADHRRAARAVNEREEELVAGHTEFAYTGLIDVTAPDPDQLERDCTALTQVAASVGIMLRPLNGRHDRAAAATLPLARGLTTRSRW